VDGGDGGQFSDSGHCHLNAGQRIRADMEPKQLGSKLLPAQGNCHNGVPIAIVIPRWERHLAAIPIEAGRLSHRFILLLPTHRPNNQLTQSPAMWSPY
jgi:hypothetical protein